MKPLCQICERNQDSTEHHCLFKYSPRKCGNYQSLRGKKFSESISKLRVVGLNSKKEETKLLVWIFSWEKKIAAEFGRAPQSAMG